MTKKECVVERREFDPGLAVRKKRDGIDLVKKTIGFKEHVPARPGHTFLGGCRDFEGKKKTQQQLGGKRNLKRDAQESKGKRKGISKPAGKKKKLTGKRHISLAPYKKFAVQEG